MIIFLYGEDTFRSREKLKELKDKYKREIDEVGSSLVTIDGETATLDDINKAVATPSLFARKRMVVIEKILASKNKQLISDVANYINDLVKAGKKNKTSKEKKASENIIIFWDEVSGDKLARNPLFKVLLKSDFAQNFKTLSNTESINWIRGRLKKENVAISRQAAIHLTSLFGGDLWQICNEVNKLVNFKLGLAQPLLANQATVTIEVNDVDQLSRGVYDENIFALTDAISHKNKARALELFEREIDAGVTDSYLLHMIVRQFRILMQVRQSLDLGHTSRKIISQLKLHPFVVQKAMGQVRNFSLPILKNIFSRLLIVDKGIKTGQADARSALSLLIAEL